YRLWFADKTKLLWQNDELTIGVPNHFVQEWLKKAFAADLQAAAHSVFGHTPVMRFHIDAELFQEARRRQAGECLPGTPACDEQPRSESEGRPPSEVRG